MFEERSRFHVIDLSVPVVSGHKSAHWVSYNIKVADVAAELSEVGEVEVPGVYDVCSVLAENIGEFFLLRGVKHPQIWCSLAN